jgi:hypothetical protein
MREMVQPIGQTEHLARFRFRELELHRIFVLRIVFVLAGAAFIDGNLFPRGKAARKRFRKRQAR